MFWPKKWEVTGGWKKLHDAHFMICTIVNSVFGLYHVDPGNDADFSEILAASVFNLEMHF
jgi:hypothetical protein